MKPQHVDFNEAVGVFCDALRKRGATSIEIGYHPLDGSDDEPSSTEDARWYAQIRMRGQSYSGEHIGHGFEAPLLALKACAEAAGISVRMQFRDKGQ